MLRRAGPSLRHFLLERKSSAGYSSYFSEVLNAQQDCFWLAAWSLARAAVVWSPGEPTALWKTLFPRQEKPHWSDLCTCLLPSISKRTSFIHKKAHCLWDCLVSQSPVLKHLGLQSTWEITVSLLEIQICRARKSHAGGVSCGP